MGGGVRPSGGDGFVDGAKEGLDGLGGAVGVRAHYGLAEGGGWLRSAAGGGGLLYSPGAPGGTPYFSS